MTTLDLLIGAVLAVGLLRGMMTGAIRQAASLLGLVVAFVLAVQLMDAVGVLVERSLGVSSSIAPILGFILVLVTVQIAVFALVRVVETVVGALRLGTLNRLAGGAVGAFKAALLLGVFFLAAAYVGYPDEESADASELYEPVVALLPAAWDWASERLPEVEGLSEKFGAQVEERLPEG